MLHSKSIWLPLWEAKVWAPISTSGLTHQDVPALAEQCRQQMQDCIDRMENELHGR